MINPNGEPVRATVKPVFFWREQTYVDERGRVVCQRLPQNPVAAAPPDFAAFVGRSVLTVNSPTGQPMLSRQFYFPIPGAATAAEAFAKFDAMLEPAGKAELAKLQQEQYERQRRIVVP